MYKADDLADIPNKEPNLGVIARTLKFKILEFKIFIKYFKITKSHRLIKKNIGSNETSIRTRRILLGVEGLPGKDIAISYICKKKEIDPICKLLCELPSLHGLEKLFLLTK